MSDTVLLTRKQAANYLTQKGCPISAKTLQNLASVTTERKGPPYYRDLQRTFYAPADLDRWRKQRLVRVE